MTTMLIKINAFPDAAQFARHVVYKLVRELTVADVEVVAPIAHVPEIHSLSPIAQSISPINALIYSTPEELKLIRNGSVRPNVSFQITPAPSTSCARDYSVCTMVHALHRICFELNPEHLTALRMPEGLAPKALDYLRGTTVTIELN